MERDQGRSLFWWTSCDSLSVSHLGSWVVGQVRVLVDLPWTVSKLHFGCQGRGRIKAGVCLAGQQSRGLLWDAERIL